MSKKQKRSSKEGDDDYDYKPQLVTTTQPSIKDPSGQDLLHAAIQHLRQIENQLEKIEQGLGIAQTGRNECVVAFNELRGKLNQLSALTASRVSVRTLEEAGRTARRELSSALHELEGKPDQHDQQSSGHDIGSPHSSAGTSERNQESLRERSLASIVASFFAGGSSTSSNPKPGSGKHEAMTASTQENSTPANRTRSHTVTYTLEKRRREARGLTIEDERLEGTLSLGTIHDLTQFVPRRFMQDAKEKTLNNGGLRRGTIVHADMDPTVFTNPLCGLCKKHVPLTRSMMITVRYPQDDVEIPCVKHVYHERCSAFLNHVVPSVNGKPICPFSDCLEE